MSENVQVELRKIFENVGVYIDEEHLDEKLVLDSLQVVNILFDIESAFNIDIEQNTLDILELESFFDYLAYIKKYLIL